MSQALVYIAGINTLLVGIGVTAYIINNFKRKDNSSETSNINSNVKRVSTEYTEDKSSENLKPGISKGEIKLEDIDNDELTAVILAAVCHASHKPIYSLKISSIKLLTNM
jgi:hypothetical protein